MTTKYVIAGVVLLTMSLGIGINARIQYNAKNWTKSNEPIVGTVLAEYYQNTLIPNLEIKGSLSSSNEIVKLESKYTLKVKTDDNKIIGVSIVDSGQFYENATKESLDAIIEEGTRISFPRGNMRKKDFFMSGNFDNRETSFQENTQMGTKIADRVRVLDIE